jgi:uncharacterized protein YecE (DUF72 family)
MSTKAARRNEAEPVIFIGTSGWQHSHWRRVFYPERLLRRKWWEHYAANFQTIEVNTSSTNA